MDIGQVVGTILLSVGKVISTPAVAKTAERVVDAAIDPRVKPISQDEARRTRTLWRASVTFSKGMRIGSTSDTYTAVSSDESLFMLFRYEKQGLIKKDQLAILQERGKLAAGGRLDLVRGYPAVLLRWEQEGFVVHELFVFVKQYLFVLLVQVKQRDEKRRSPEIESFFSSFRVS